MESQRRWSAAGVAVTVQVAAVVVVAAAAAAVAVVVVVVRCNSQMYKGSDVSKMIDKRGVLVGRGTSCGTNGLLENASPKPKHRPPTCCVRHSHPTAHKLCLDHPKHAFAPQETVKARQGSDCHETHISGMLS